MVDPNRSVTCAICGNLADERGTLPLNPEEIREASPENFELIGRAAVAREAFGEGEAHQKCLVTEALLEAIEEQD